MHNDDVCCIKKRNRQDWDFSEKYFVIVCISRHTCTSALQLLCYPEGELASNVLCRYIWDGTVVADIVRYNVITSEVSNTARAKWAEQSLG